MTEDLLAIVTIVAVWKVVQVWVLKARVRRVVNEKQAVVLQAIRDVEAMKVRVNNYVNNATPGAVRGHSFFQNEEWPAEID